MIRFDSNSLGTVTIRFRHNLPSVEVKRNNDLIAMVQGIKITQGSTECELEMVKDGQFDGYFGKAYTHPSDQYKKETGRLLSLQRAIQAAGLTASEEREVMAGYYAR